MKDGVMDLASGIERVIGEKRTLTFTVDYAITQLTLIRETCPDEKTRAIAAGAIGTIKEMTK